MGIITALHDPEFHYLLKLDANWQKRKHPNDSTIYYEGIFADGNKKLKVVAAASPQMGMPASTTLSLKIIEHYRPKYIVMVGIAAGVKGKCELGDILIADMSWDYGNGKMRRKRDGVTFEPDPRSLSLSIDLKEKFLNVIRDKTFLEEIKAGWVASDIETKLNAHIGPIASGAAVLEDPELIKEIMGHNRKLIGIEMEIYGLFYAATNCTEPRPCPLAIKSVCDFGDSKKNDVYQKYASYVSSRFLYNFALSEL
jgi:nucleoside phosphorylase